MFAAYVFTIIDSQDMQERNRLGPVAVTPGRRAPLRAHRRRPGRAGGPAIDRRARQTPGPFGLFKFLLPNGPGFTIPANRDCLVFGPGHSRRAGMMRGDEQVKLPPLPRDGYAPSGHALPDMRPHRRASARQSQRSPDRALPAGTPGSARPPFRIAGPR